MQLPPQILGNFMIPNKEVYDIANMQLDNHQLFHQLVKFFPIFMDYVGRSPLLPLDKNVAHMIFPKSEGGSFNYLNYEPPLP